MRVLIVGASLACLRTIEALRAVGCEDRVTLLGDETHAPYDRPPLSKELLTGALGPEGISLCDEAGLAALDIELALGVRATGLDARERKVITDTGVFRYDELVIATGARALRLPEFEGFERVHVLRTVEDAVAIDAALATGKPIVIIGGGFVGSEVASAARVRGVQATVLEARDAPMRCILGDVIGARLGRLHEEAGSLLRCGARVTGPVGGMAIEGVRLDDGTVIEAATTIVGVGSVPNTEWLAGAGIDVHDGVACDSRGRAADGVHAVGDVAPCPGVGSRSWRSHAHLPDRRRFCLPTSSRSDSHRASSTDCCGQFEMLQTVALVCSPSNRTSTRQRRSLTRAYVLQRGRVQIEGPADELRGRLDEIRDSYLSVAPDATTPPSSNGSGAGALMSYGHPRQSVDASGAITCNRVVRPAVQVHSEHADQPEISTLEVTVELNATKTSPLRARATRSSRDKPSL